MMAHNTCYQCGTNAPVSDQLGWLVVQYAGAPDWERRFCGGICLHTWNQQALDRLTRAIIGTEETDR